MRQLPLAAGLLALCPAATLAASPGAGHRVTASGDHLRITRGGASLTLQAALLLDHRPSPGARGAPRPRRHVLARWRAVPDPHRGACLQATTADAFVEATVWLCQPTKDLRLRVEADLQFRRAGATRLAALELTLAVPADRVRALHRDLRLRPLPLRGALHQDRWTPHLVTGALGPGTGHLTLRGDAGLDGVLLGRAGPARVTVRLELDDARNHPLRYHRACVARWRPRLPRAARNERLRQAGETLGGGAWLHLGPRPAIALWRHRFPAGRRAAVVLTDHADQARLETTRAVAWGAGRSGHPRYGKGGLLGNGLVYTASFFWGGAWEVQPAGDPAYGALLGAMRRRGVAVALHSATPLADRRAATRGALRWLQAVGGRTWIDHSPATNCEAYANQGWRPGSPWFLADLLYQAGVRYLWTGEDASHLPPGTANLLAPQGPGRRRVLLFPHGRDPHHAPRGFWLWTSQWTYEPRTVALRRWGRASLDRLETEAGVHIAHVYLEALHPPGHRLHRRNLLQRAAGGTPVVHPGFAAVLADLAARQRAGTTWTTTLDALADHLIGLATLTLRYPDAQTLLVTNPGARALTDVTFTVASPVTPEVDGRPAKGVRHTPRATRFWLDLPAGASRRIRLRQGGALVPLLP